MDVGLEIVQQILWLEKESEKSIKSQVWKWSEEEEEAILTEVQVKW